MLEKVTEDKLDAFMRLMDFLSRLLAVLAIGGAIGWIILPALRVVWGM